MKKYLFTLGLILSSAFSFGQISPSLQKAIDLVGMEPEKALPLLEKEIKKNPNSSEAYYYLGLAKSNITYSDGFEEFSKAIELNPCYSEAYNIRGTMQDDRETALADYNKAIECDPGYGGYYYNRAGTLEELGRYEDALRDCRKALELAPEIDHFIYIIAARAKSGLGDYKGALEDCNKVIEFSGDFDPSGYVTRGDVKMLMKDFKGAAEDYQKDTEFPETDMGYSFIKLGEAKLAAGDQKGACEAFQKAYKLELEFDISVLENCK